MRLLALLRFVPDRPWLPSSWWRLGDYWRFRKTVMGRRPTLREAWDYLGWCQDSARYAKWTDRREATEGDEMVDIAFAVLYAAILCRDLLHAMPPKLLVSMPPDLLNRLSASYYQDSFNRLPAHIQAEARRLVMADPYIIEARRVDGSGATDA